MSIHYYLVCLENSKKIFLGSIELSENGKKAYFFPGSKENRKEKYTPEDAKEAIVQFLIRHIGKTFALIPDDDIDLIDSFVDYYDEKHHGKNGFNEEHEINLETLINNNDNYNYLPDVGVRGMLSPMTIDCIDRTVSHFDWTSTIDAIFGRLDDKEYEKKIRSFFYWSNE
jgi:hypothetical protein